MQVKDKVIIIAGGAGGLGSAMARLLAEKGARLFIFDLDQEKGEALAEELRGKGAQADFLRVDLVSEGDWLNAMAQVKAKAGRLDVMINNAGINIRKPIEEMNLEEWDRMMHINTGSVFLGCKHAIGVMRAQGGGAIINTSSVCGLIGHRYTPEAYTASKGAVTLLTKAIASRYAKYGIRCNSIHPSTVDTPFVQLLFKDPEQKRQRLEEVPLGRLASAEDVAYAVLYLCSDEASFLNGVALPIDGGVTCY